VGPEGDTHTQRREKVGLLEYVPRGWMGVAIQCARKGTQRGRKGKSPKSGGRPERQVRKAAVLFVNGEEKSLRWS